MGQPRYGLTDFEWSVIEPLPPSEPSAGARASIKPMSGRKRRPPFSASLYRCRNVVERFFSQNRVALHDSAIYQGPSDARRGVQAGARP